MKIREEDFKIKWHDEEQQIKKYEQYLIGSFNIAKNFNFKINCLNQQIFGKQINCLYFPFVIEEKEFLKLPIKNIKTKKLLAKFIYLICKKYYEVVQLYFEKKHFEQKTFNRLNETMYKESCKTIEKIIAEFNEFKNIELLDSLVSSYVQFWVSIFKEMVQLTLDTFEFEDMYDEMANLTEIIQTKDTYSNFDTFIEETIMQIINDEQVEAFKFFGLREDSTKNDFKKIYRKLSKKYHPDLASGSEEIMQKINYYKIILDNYFNGVDNE